MRVTNPFLLQYAIVTLPGLTSSGVAYLHDSIAQKWCYLSPSPMHAHMRDTVSRLVVDGKLLRQSVVGRRSFTAFAGWR